MMPRANSLRKIRFYRKGLLASLILLGAAVVSYYYTSLTPSVREAIVIAGVAIYAVFTLLVIFSRCPCCGQLFHNVLGFSNPLSRNCSHCGQPLDADHHA